MGFRHTLRTPDGDDAGEVEYADGGVQAGDEILVSGNRRMRVTAATPTVLIEESVDRRAVCGVLEVEPLNEMDELRKVAALWKLTVH